MITLRQGERFARYLGHNLGFCNDFTQWLEKLGLSKLPYDLNPYDWVRYGWIEPVLRVDIPESFYLIWENYPERPAVDAELPEKDRWALYCQCYSYPTLDDPPENWFLHVFDQPDSEAKEFLKHKTEGYQNFPEDKEHPRGRGIKFNSCWLYFSHWQGYHVIDLLNQITLFPSIPNVPDALDRLEVMKEQHAIMRERRNIAIEAVKNKWEHHGSFWEIISYYRTLQGLSLHYLWKRPNDERHLIREEGLRKLTAYLNVTPESLERGIEKHLLTVFQEWALEKEKDKPFYAKALPQIQKDIYYAVEWLCSLTGEPIDTYFKKWKYPDRSPRSWAELKKALPFEYKETIDYFLGLAPHYLAKFNEELPERERLQDERLEWLIKKLYKEYSAFRRFCRAFRKLHDYIKTEGEIDFRELEAFFDYFLLLALRTETILLEFVNSTPVSVNNSSLKKLLLQLSLKADSVKTGVALALQLWKQCTDLKSLPPDPFNVIENEIQKLSCRDQAAKKFAEYFLTAGMIRNYFAHHSYLDHMMAQKEIAAKSLISLLVTVLFLASARQI